VNDDIRKIIRGLSLDVDILVRELYGRPGVDVETAVRAIDRMLTDLRRLREQLVSQAARRSATDPAEASEDRR
jgi:hypothetical protein